MTFLFDLEAAAADFARLNPAKTKRFNPRPPGLPRPGSASAIVLAHLQEVAGLRTHAQIVMAINRKREVMRAPPVSRKAIDWALLYLRRQGLIECVGEGKGKHPLRYRATPAKAEGDAT